MSASDDYKAGKLESAIAAQVQEVKANPADHARRIFLYELLCFSGEIDRARRQIDAIHYGEDELDLTAASYRKLLDSEAARRKFFEDGTPPEILGEETPHLKLRIEAAGHIRLGRKADAAALLAEAESLTPTASGTLNGKPFTAFRDADDLFSGVLEVMAQGKYFWVALEQVASIAMNPPKFPRDLLYAPARLELLQETGEVFLPALYPGSHAGADDTIRLGRMTDWSDPEAGPVRGLGSRLFLVDDDAVTLVEWRQVVFDEPTAEAAAPGPESEPEPVAG